MIFLGIYKWTMVAIHFKKTRIYHKVLKAYALNDKKLMTLALTLVSLNKPWLIDCNFLIGT
jgi:hypothetical protein